MPNMQDLKQRLKEIRDAVEARLPDIAVALTLSAKALAERNIKEKGFGAEYSRNKVPAWFLHGKELNAAGTKFLQDRGVNTTTGEQGKPKKRRRKKGETGDPAPFSTMTNWGEFRVAQGLQDEHVDVSYSNKMWANMQPVKVEQKGDTYLAPLGATNTEAQNKMNWNRDRYGDFIGKALGDDERAIMTSVVVDEVTNIIDQFLPRTG
jgi:hypothetical protein